jgi:hypothetical protein
MARKAYVGKAGQLAAMAEFLLRGYNVAMPEVDEGEDIFVVEGKSGRLWRIQVKTAVGKQRQGGWRAKYSVGSNQIKDTREPELFYIFALRRESTWEFLMVGQKQLRREVADHQAGSQSGANILFTVTFRDTDVLCSLRDWQAWRNNWSEWPIIEAS